MELDFIQQCPVEEEELTPQTMNALNQSSAQLDRGESVSHKDILIEFVSFCPCGVKDRVD